MSLICSATIPCCTGEESGNQRITNPKLTENKALNKYLNFLMTKLIVFLIYMTQNLVITMWNMVWNEKICLCVHISISVNTYSYFIWVYIILLSLHFFLCKNFHIFKHTHTHTCRDILFSDNISPLKYFLSCIRILYFLKIILWILRVHQWTDHLRMI